MKIAIEKFSLELSENLIKKLNKCGKEFFNEPLRFRLLVNKDASSSILHLNNSNQMYTCTEKRPRLNKKGLKTVDPPVDKFSNNCLKLSDTPLVVEFD